MGLRRALCVVVAGMAVVGCGSSTGLDDSGPVSGWESYGADGGATRFSPLTQITPENVADLEVAWTFHTGETDTSQASAFELTPLLVDDRLVLCTPHNRVVALEPSTGDVLWSFDPELDGSVDYSNQFVCRGVSVWRSQSSVGEHCDRRILTATNDSRLIALDLADGSPCGGFGHRGEVDLRVGVGKVAYPGEYHVTSPPAIFGNLAIVGSAIGDNTRVDAPSGVVRAYDVLSGELVWAWQALPPDLESPPPPVSDDPEAWRAGTANVWSTISVDEELGLVYLPTGNTSPDYWAADRRGSDFYSSSVVALQGASGEVAWAFQTVHHDLWDFDVPAPPSLVDLEIDGREIPALVQPTKMGILFVLDRRDGTPVFEIVERPVPQTDVPGEITSPTQPFPAKPPPIARHDLDPGEAFGLTPFDRSGCREKLESLRWDGIYTPPSLEGSLMFPGNAGGSNWGGVAIDPVRRWAIGNVMNMAWSVKLIPRDRFLEEARAEPNVEFGRQLGTPYGMRREMLMSSFGIPCTPAPWGTLSAVDLEAGTLVWQVPLGTIRDISPVPLPIGRWGTPSIGGPIVTAGGLIFIGAAMDDYLRAFDLSTGEELWKGRVPAGPQATPMTYRMAGGRQFVVIAAGGHARAGTRLGDALVAFALPAD